MLKRNLFNRVNLELYSGLLSVVLMPVSKRMLLLSMYLWLIITLVNIVIDIFQKEKKQNKLKNLFFLLTLPALYLLHIIGMLYTSNIQYGLFDLEIKLSFIIIPIIIYFRSYIYSKNEKNFFKALIIGCLISFGINITGAISNYSVDPSLNHFYYSRLSPDFHPSYLALYVGVSMTSLLFYNTKIFNWFQKFNWVILIFILIVLISYLILLSSKAGIIAFFISLAVFSGIKWSQKIPIKYALIVSALIILLPIVLIWFIPSLNVRFQSVFSAIKNSDSAFIDSSEGSMERMAIIKSTYLIAEENLPWGTGTGDVKDVITKYYLAKGSTTIESRYLNAHNQFFQTIITLGIPGLILLLLFFIAGFILVYRTKNLLFLAFLIMIFIHFLFESMFEVQAGVVFISLFYTLFCVWEPHRKSKEFPT